MVKVHFHQSSTKSDLLCYSAQLPFHVNRRQVLPPFLHVLSFGTICRVRLGMQQWSQGMALLYEHPVFKEIAPLQECSIRVLATLCDVRGNYSDVLTG
jgi:hypothetical protein